MTIKGIGTDIIEIERIFKAIERRGTALIKKLFTKNEIDYCKKYKNPYPYFAARFAAKEAVVKALGFGFGKISFHDIEIIKDKRGKPSIKFSSKVMKDFDNPNIHLSISHSEAYALAFAIYS